MARKHAVGEPMIEIFAWFEYANDQGTHPVKMWSRHIVIGPKGARQRMNNMSKVWREVKLGPSWPALPMDRPGTYERRSYFRDVTVPAFEEYLRERNAANVVRGNNVRWSMGKPSSTYVTVPSIHTIMRHEQNAKGHTPCGCVVEPDGTCKHGHKTWQQILGIL